jgi:DNA (cytosine-5)-methyltransferase 1
VFVVAHIGSWQPAASVLFESDCLQGNSKESKQKRKTTSSNAKESSGSSGQSTGIDPNLMATLCANDNEKLGSNQWVNEGKAIIEPTSSWCNGEQTAATLTKQNANGAQRMPDKDNFGAVLEPKAHAFKVRGGSETETGEQGGTPGKKAGKGYLGQDEKAFIIGTTQDQQIAQPIAIQGNLIGRDAGGPQGIGVSENGIMYTQTKADVHGVAQPIKWLPPNGEETIGTLRARDYKGIGNDDLQQGRGLAIAQPIVYENHPADSRVKEMGETCQTVSARFGTGGGNVPLVQQPIAVDCYNQTINEKTSQTIGSSASDVNHYGAVLQPVYNVTMEVQKRKFEVDVEALKVCLKTHKNLTNNEIAEILNVPKTKVEHWFRSDKSFSIPDPECWYQLKELLKIETDVFDKSITEFIIDENKYDSGNRIYDTNFPSPTLTSASSGNDIYLQNIAPTITQCKGSRGGSSMEALDEVSAVFAQQPTMAIRRLTPRECERLQGFPDDWTLIPYRNKPADQCPDGPRYKACGNSMAVPCMAYLGRRIQMVDDILNEQNNGAAAIPQL